MRGQAWQSIVCIRPLAVEIFMQAEVWREGGKRWLTIAGGKFSNAFPIDTVYTTYPAPSFAPNRKTCIVPLSLHTQISLSSLLKATPYITARSAPRRNSLVRFPVWVSHIRISVPREEVVARNRPEGGTVKVVSALSWAIIISLGCLVGDGAGGRGVGSKGFNGGGGQGGRWMRCTWPVWRPGIASRVAWGADARARRPGEWKLH